MEERRVNREAARTIRNTSALEIDRTNSNKGNGSVESDLEIWLPKNTVFGIALSRFLNVSGGPGWIRTSRSRWSERQAGENLGAWDARRLREGRFDARPSAPKAVSGTSPKVPIFKRFYFKEMWQASGSWLESVEARCSLQLQNRLQHLGINSPAHSAVPAGSRTSCSCRNTPCSSGTSATVSCKLRTPDMTSCTTPVSSAADRRSAEEHRRRAAYCDQR